MSATIIDGKKIANEIREEIKLGVQKLQDEKGIVPGLAVVIVGEDPASQVYVNMKEKACEKLGFYSLKYELPTETTQEELLALVDSLNNNDKIHGILVQMPLPKHLNDKAVINSINPEKDVDGFHPYNVGKLLIGDDTFKSCTPYGCQVLLEKSGVKTSGAHMVIVGRSNIVGKPLAAMMMQKAKNADCTVTVCHSRTKDIASITRQADILVAAIGSPLFIKADMVKQGAVVIDVGVNRVDDPTSPKGYKLVGDVDFEAVKEVASAITPSPGGVGPMTITMLLSNALLSAQIFTTKKHEG